jgi:tRNA threonylcarbamoyladenosine biosynthesis protein TsaE
MTTIKASLDEINIVSDEILTHFDKHLVVLLRGELASGKTTLSKYIIRNYSKREILSPTFVKMCNYDDIVFHYDLYQLSVNDFISKGLFDNLDLSGLHILEWGGTDIEQLLIKYEIKFLVVNIKTLDDDRIYNIEA